MAADDEMVSWQERLVHARESFLRSERGSYARGHRSVPVEHSLQPFAVDPDLTQSQGHQDSQDDELDARLLTRTLVRIHEQIRDVRIHSHPCADPGRCSGFRGEVGFDAVCETAIPYELKLGYPSEQAASVW